MNHPVFPTSSAQNRKSIVTGTLFIAGSSIGIGILALPIPLGMVGLIPSFFLFLFSFFIMLSSSFILVELYNFEKEEVNLFTLVRKHLGTSAASFLRIIYALLFTALIFAYLNKGGQLLVSRENAQFLASVFLALIGIFFTLTSKQILDRFNRIAVVLLFIAYFSLFFFPVTEGKGNPAYINMKYFMGVIPFSVVTFGYHNMIPSIKQRFDLSGQNLKKICLLGAGITFLIYFTWIAKVLLSLPLEGALGIIEAYQNQKLSSEVLAQVVPSRAFAGWVQAFSLLAIITSLIGQKVSITDFLLDSFTTKESKNKRLALAIAISALCLGCIHYYPNLFYTILELCGGIFTIAIFCVYPSLIYLRTWKKYKLNPKYKMLSWAVLLVGCLIIGYEIGKYAL